MSHKSIRYERTVWNYESNKSPVAGSCERSNDGKLIDYLNEYQLLELTLLHGDI
jgi:hypothetical protein